MLKILIAVLMLFGAVPHYGYVTEKTYEGGTECNDFYIVNLDGNLCEVKADDLEVNDPVTCYTIGDKTVLTVYEWR